MEGKYHGYVIYSKVSHKSRPIGVVSSNNDCHAITNYIPKRIKDILIEIEDRRFYTHSGIDIYGIIRALIVNLKSGKVVQGGSSITQQLARNILKNNSRTLSKKIVESFNAIKFELRFSKDEILELYLNNVYFGKNLIGIRSASLYYFRKEVSDLNFIESLALITILRGPNYYIAHLEKAKIRLALNNKILFKRNCISNICFQNNGKANFLFNRNPLQLINEICIPYIFESVCKTKMTIYSTIYHDIQKLTNALIANSKCKVSLVAIKNKKVVAFGSSNGLPYPFIANFSVGSTLKPFLYCYLRQSGISQSETFNSYHNNFDCNLGDVQCDKELLTLEEALFYSSNNCFINACERIGIEKSLKFLASLFNRKNDDFLLESILGVTRTGISLHDLAFVYSTFFNNKKINTLKSECLIILNAIAKQRINCYDENVFLKTGTTNNNRDMFAVIGSPKITFAILGTKDLLGEELKYGDFWKEILNVLKDN